MVADPTIPTKKRRSGEGLAVCLLLCWDRSAETGPLGGSGGSAADRSSKWRLLGKRQWSKGEKRCRKKKKRQRGGAQKGRRNSSPGGGTMRKFRNGAPPQQKGSGKKKGNQEMSVAPRKGAPDEIGSEKIGNGPFSIRKKN